MNTTSEIFMETNQAGIQRVIDGRKCENLSANFSQRVGRTLQFFSLFCEY